MSCPSFDPHSVDSPRVRFSDKSPFRNLPIHITKGFRVGVWVENGWFRHLICLHDIVVEF